MSKKQQEKLKRQFSYLKRQFKKAEIDLSEMKFEDLKQKNYKTLNRMRAELLRTSKVFGDKNITVTRNDKILVDDSVFKVSKLGLDEFDRRINTLILKKDEFYSYKRVYREEGVRVGDYNLSAFYDLYNKIWNDENAGYSLSYLVREALKNPDGVEAEFLTQDLRINDYELYTFKEWR